MAFDLKLAETLGSAQDERDLGQAMLAVTDRVGARSFQVLRFASTEHGKALDEMGSYSDGLLVAYSQGYPDTSDPVMQHLRCSSTPILWDRDYYARLGAASGKTYEILADFGIGFGASIAAHVGAFRHFAMDFAWPHHVSPDPRLLMELHLYAIHAEPAFYRVWSRAELAALQPQERIEERELQTLYMASRGYKVPAIAAYYQRSPRTFEKHAQSVMSKLGASTIAEAVSIAERLQLFDKLRARDASHQVPRRWKF